ncbi:hypothetical protein M378DRAFT_154787 [Amanita muscaria Koide BX008]|uniref:Uncharacterized protein n=1 Tax=Amanita muscaria (strain Koide BX008) TaxID=946122 RepID=A0A0C2XA43_AMAMK|nr:hypothetical protein M378DRAFT_154787 [Amanita muscaria Koide BX008]
MVRVPTATACLYAEQSVKNTDRFRRGPIAEMRTRREGIQLGIMGLAGRPWTDGVNRKTRDEPTSSVQGTRLQLSR